MTAESVGDRLRALVAQYAPDDGTHPTAIDGLHAFRVSTPLARLPAVYEPSVCVLVQGSKHAYHGGRTHTYRPGSYLCTAAPTPLETEIAQATFEEPVLGVLVSLDTRPMTELLIRYRARTSQQTQAEGAPGGPVVASSDEAFDDALLRVLELLDDRSALDLLGSGRLRELLYLVIEGPAGALVLDTLGAPANRLGPVFEHIRDHLDRPLGIDDLADLAGLSRAAFDRQFKAVTGTSPLRYVKALRLNDAALRLANGSPVAEAAASVGYPSPSQFSREFKRHFGVAPKNWSGPAHV